MDLSTLGNLGSFISGVAVVVSLIYLAVQVRQNTRSVRAASFQALSESLSDRTLRLAEDADLHGIYTRGLRGEDLSEQDSQRFGTILMSLLRVSSNPFVQYRAGFLTEDQWQRFAVCRSPFYRREGAEIFGLGRGQCLEQSSLRSSMPRFAREMSAPPNQELSCRPRFGSAGD